MLKNQCDFHYHFGPSDRSPAQSSGAPLVKARAEYVKGVVSPIQIGGQENYEIKI